MKFFILGDTHHKLDKAVAAGKKLKGVDLIIHTGDYMDDAEELSEILGIPFVAVKGNCDGSISSQDYEIVEAECGNILVTHGHMQNADYSFDRLLYLAEENDCMAAVFGHTHVPCFEEYDGIYLINPGSLTRPRDGSQGSYAVATSTDSTFACSIVYYKAEMFEKAKGGYIKGMLNYSDRF